MKKAKLMLSGLCILAVLGTAFAFKADRFSNHYIYTGALTQDGGATACTQTQNGAAISNGTANVRASTTTLASGCPQVFTAAISDL